MPRSKGIPIKHWHAKRELLKKLYGAGRFNKDLFGDDGVLSPDRIIELAKLGVTDRANYQIGAANTAQSWDKAGPVAREYLLFWDWVIQDWNFNVPMIVLWQATFVEFVGYIAPVDEPKLSNHVQSVIGLPDIELDPETKAKLEKMYPLPKSKSSDPSGIAEDTDEDTDPAEFILRFNKNTKFEGPLTGLSKEGAVSHHQFYNSPEAASAWKALVDSKGYRVYLECLASLKNLCKSIAWKNAVDDGRYTVAVSLGGGGAPLKDWEVVSSLYSVLPKDANLQYWLTDISFSMLKDSGMDLRERLLREKRDDRVDDKMKLLDFMNLEQEFRRRDSWRQVVWLLLGGTIGNIENEKEFFRSLSGPSKVDDLLIIGIDTLKDGETKESLEDRVNAEYIGKAADDFIQASAKGVVTRRGGGDPERLVSVAVVEDFIYSKVPNSQTAVFSAPTEAGEKVFVISTRYLLDEFKIFASVFKWELLGMEQPSAESTFRQLLFRRVE